MVQSSNYAPDNANKLKLSRQINSRDTVKANINRFNSMSHSPAAQGASTRRFAFGQKTLSNDFWQKSQLEKPQTMTIGMTLSKEKGDAADKSRTRGFGTIGDGKATTQDLPTVSASQHQVNSPEVEETKVR